MYKNFVIKNIIVVVVRNRNNTVEEVQRNASGLLLLYQAGSEHEIQTSGIYIANYLFKNVFNDLP